MSGDSLFAGSIGRTDFPTGSMTDLISNLKAKILTLDENLTVSDVLSIADSQMYIQKRDYHILMNKKKANKFTT